MLLILICFILLHVINIFYYVQVYRNWTFNVDYKNMDYVNLLNIL